MLATQSLVFNAQRQCCNKPVMAALIDTLSDKSSSDQLIVTILKNAYEHNYQPELNQIIQNIQALHGPDTVLINKNIVRHFADEGLDLIQNQDGTVHISTQTAVICNPDRHGAIRLVTGHHLPETLIRLVCAYEDELDISDDSFYGIAEILMSKNIAAKSQLIAAASHQNKIAYLNGVFAALKLKKYVVDLSHADLSHLDLTGIDLENINLSQCNLNQTNLTRAKLIRANLRQARLIGANLAEADFRHAVLLGACLLCANLKPALPGTLAYLGGAELHFSLMPGPRHQISAKQPSKEPVIALIVPTGCDRRQRTGLMTDRSTGIIVIDEAEKNSLLDCGIAITDNEDGTVQLRRAIKLHTDPQRRLAIDRSLAPDFPTVLSELIASYDTDLEISEQNIKVIVNIFESTDQMLKGLLISAASRQKKIEFINELFRSGDVKPDLSYVDFSNLDLEQIHLSGLNLTGANFRHCNLKSAFFAHAKLFNATFTGANLSEINLTGANLTGARLVCANLTRAALNDAILTEACLLGANLHSVDLSSAERCWGLIIQFADLEHVIPAFNKCFFFNGLPPSEIDAYVVPETQSPTQPNAFSDLPGHQKPLRPQTIVITESEKDILLASNVTLRDNSNGTVRLTKAPRMFQDNDRYQATNSTLEQVLPTTLTKLIADYDGELEISPNNEPIILDCLRSTDQSARARIIAAASRQGKFGYLNNLFQRWMPYLDLSHIDLSNLNLRGINLYKAKLVGATMHGCDLLGANLSEANLTGANLNGAFLYQARLPCANLTNATLIGAKLTNAQMMQTTWHRAVLKFAKLNGSDLRYANLKGAWLDHAILEGVDLSQADLRKASLTHTKMCHATLYVANLAGANLMHADLTKVILKEVDLTNTNFSHAWLHSISITESSEMKGAVWTGTSFKKIYSDEVTMRHMPLSMWLHASTKK